MNTTIEKVGQAFVDEPIYTWPKTISVAVARVFKSRVPEPIVTHHQRVNLKWMKPDGKGGLVPR